MTTDKKETKKTIEPLNWLDAHDLNEVFETTQLDILPKYDIIKTDDLTTIRKIKITSLPISKHLEVKGKELDLTFITISDNEMRYSLPFNSIALQRSFIGVAIKLSKAKSVAEIDFSKVLNKIIGIKREQFEAKGFTQAPFKFFLLD